MCPSKSVGDVEHRLTDLTSTGVGEAPLSTGPKVQDRGRTVRMDICLFLLPLACYSCSPHGQVMKGLRLGGLKEALDMIAKGEAEAEEFKAGFSDHEKHAPLE